MKTKTSSILLVLVALFPVGVLADGHHKGRSSRTQHAPRVQRHAPAPRAVHTHRAHTPRVHAPRAVHAPRLHAPRAALPHVHIPHIHIPPVLIPQPHVQKRWIEGHYETVWVEGRCDYATPHESVCYEGHYARVWKPGYYEVVSLY